MGWKIDVTQSYKLDKDSVLSEPDDTRKCPSCKVPRSAPLGFTLKSGKHHCRVCGAAICEEIGCSLIHKKQWYCGTGRNGTRSKFCLTKITPNGPNNLEDEDPKKEKEKAVKAHFPGSWDRQLGQVFIEKVNAVHRAAHFTKMRGKAV